MSPREIAEDFPDQQEINQVMKGKLVMPSDRARRAVYEVQLARLEARKERKEEAEGEKAAPPPADKATDTAISATTEQPAGASGMSDVANAIGEAASTNPPSSDDVASASAQTMSTAAPAKPGPEDDEQARLREAQLYSDLDVQQLLSLSPDQRYKKVLAMPLDELVAVADSLRGGKGEDFLEGLTPEQKETLLALNNPPQVVDGELAQAKLLRAIYSQRQLEEVMTDFWFNHFNVFAGKGLDRMMLTSYERDVIRPHAVGKFEDLLVATAKSPAMLFYLDNWLSVGPNSPRALGVPEHPYGPYARFPHPNRKRPSGLNENYGRELLELQTLSVNGGYSQRDVTEVAESLYWMDHRQASPRRQGSNSMSGCTNRAPSLYSAIASNQKAKAKEWSYYIG